MQSEKEKLYEHVDFYRDLLGLSLDQPVKLVDVLAPHSQFEIEYCDFKTPGLCGVAMVGNKTDTIILNLNRTSEEQNFDCGHEFLHLTKHRKIQDSFNCFTNTKPQQRTFLEWQANEGSAQLLVPFLVPYQDFIPRFLKLLESEAFGIQYTLAEYYHVTPQVINIRLDNLSYEIDQYREGARLDCLELLSRRQRTQRGITSTCYRALCDFALDWDSVIGF